MVPVKFLLIASVALCGSPVSGFLNLPGLPNFPGLLPIPGLPSIPALPSIPGFPSFPSVPSLPGLPPIPGLPATPVNPVTLINMIINALLNGQPLDSNTINLLLSQLGNSNPALAASILGIFDALSQGNLDFDNIIELGTALNINDIGDIVNAATAFSDSLTQENLAAFFQMVSQFAGTLTFDDIQSILNSLGIPLPMIEASVRAVVSAIAGAERSLEEAVVEAEGVVVDAAQAARGAWKAIKAILANTEKNAAKLAIVEKRCHSKKPRNVNEFVTCVLKKFTIKELGLK